MNTLNQYRDTVPALFSDSPIEGVSQNYTFIPTYEVVQRFLNLGWEIRDARQKKALDPTKAKFKKHYIRLSHPDYKTSVVDDEISPEIILMNGHDKKTAYRIKLGILRHICWNGLVAGSFFSSFKLTHYNIAQGKLDTFHDYLTDLMPKMLGAIESWSLTNLTLDQQDRFVKEAVQLRFPDRSLNLDEVNLIRRAEDKFSTLWHVYNRVQENLILGGIKVFNPETGKGRKSRAIKDPERNVKFNEDLFDIASRYYQEITSNGTTQTEGKV